MALTGRDSPAMFIAIPTGMNYRTERYPVVTLSLIGINTLVWLVSLILEIVTHGDSQDWIMQYLWLIPAKSFVWTYLTSMFVHAGFFHLLGNMIFLFLFGACVEDMIGRKRFIIFYLLGGLAAGLVYIAMTPEHFHSEIPMGGASGAISGCLGMYLLLRAAAEIEFKYFLWLLIYVRAGSFEIPAWVAISFWFLKDLAFGVWGMFHPNDHGGGVAFGAHVGGLLGGLTLVAAYQWLGKRPTDEPASTPELLFDPVKALAGSTPPFQPAAATSEVPTIFLHDGVAQTGPFTLSQVQAMLQHGEISPAFSYWSEGMEQWQSVMDLSGTPM